jgi:serine protease Do
VVPLVQPVDRIAAVAATVGPTVVQLETESGLGSGVIYNASGLILTAAHVVEGEPSVAVRLADGRLFEGEVLGTHGPTDIAVIAIDGLNLPTATLGYGDQLQVGELAVALGSPFGFDQTVTSGIVSSVNRTVNGVPMVQTDAAINPGNSGGPLVDGSGRVIGINDVIFSSGGGADGVGFAISIDVAIVVADQIVSGGEIQLAILGVSAVQSTTGEPGAIIQSILDGSAADAASLEVGDRIVAINNAAVQDPNDLFASIVRNRPGSNVTVEVLRNGESITLSAVLGAIAP